VTIEQLLEQALGVLRSQRSPLTARFQLQVWLSPIEKFVYDVVPPMEGLLRSAYDAFQNEQWDFDEDFTEAYEKELTLARAIVGE
jgi:hypothetical protein